MSAGESPTASPPPLEYGFAPPRRDRRIIRGTLILVALGLCYAWWQWGADVWQQLPMLYWQRQCLRYAEGPGKVVYEETPTDVARLLTGGCVPYKLMRGGSPDPTPVKSVAAATPIPKCWTRFSDLALTKIQKPGSNSGAIVFLHERRSRGGNRRLVCVRYIPETYSFMAQFTDGYNCESFAITPGRLHAMPTVAATISPKDIVSSFPPQPPTVRVYAGQVDPKDEARFTIRYEMWGKSDTLDGRLSDSDYVTLTPRVLPTPD